jgi:DNA uptake protein ComE-like DNA-binding protein
MMEGKARAAFEEKPPSARAAGLSEAMTAVVGDGNSLYYNPAGLRFSRHKEVLSSYTRLFSLSELPYHYFAMSLPTESRGAWGLSVSQFGPAPYREQEVALTHSVFLTPLAAFGYTLRRATLDVKRYGSASALCLDAGVAGQIAPPLKAGFSVRNINHANLGSSPEGPAQQLRAGLAFRPAGGFLTALDAVKPVDGEISYRAGQEVQLAPMLALRFGVETAPSRYSAGFGFRWKAVRIDYAFLTHPLLNDQQHASVSLWWGPEEELQVAEAEVKRSARRKAKKASKSQGPSEKVDLNSATIEQLMTLPGIGRVTAQNILDHRKERGGFTQELDLLDVPKFQRRIFIRVRPYITVGPAAPSVAPAGEAPAEGPAEPEEPLPEEPLEEEEAPAVPEEPAIEEETEEDEEPGDGAAQGRR